MFEKSFPQTVTHISQKAFSKYALIYTGDIMKITYINHSGFLLETRECYYIFDYYKGELPNLDKEKEVIICRI